MDDMQISEINLRDPRDLIVLFYESVTNTMVTSTAWNICKRDTGIFSNFPWGHSANLDGLYSDISYGKRQTV